MNAVISDAVAILREFRNASDEEILRKLLAAGVERVVASRLFQRKLADGSLSVERPLDSEPLWAEIVSFARSEKRTGVTGDALLVIAGRSSEFDAVNHLANRGSKLKDIVLTPTIFQWPEEGLTL